MVCPEVLVLATFSSDLSSCVGLMHPSMAVIVIKILVIEVIYSSKSAFPLITDIVG